MIRHSSWCQDISGSRLIGQTMKRIQGRGEINGEHDSIVPGERHPLWYLRSSQPHWVFKFSQILVLMKNDGLDLDGKHFLSFSWMITNPMKTFAWKRFLWVDFISCINEFEFNEVVQGTDYWVTWWWLLRIVSNWSQHHFWVELITGAAQATASTWTLEIYHNTSSTTQYPPCTHPKCSIDN